MGSLGPGTRVGIVKNFAENKAGFAIEMMASFEDLIQASAPNSTVEWIDPLHDLPNPSLYDIVILTGGTYNLASEPYEPWVRRELDWIQSMHEVAPKTRLLGFCWGHQAISRALNGRVEFVPASQKQVMGRQTEQLLQPGKSFFQKDELQLIHFRVRRVAQPGDGAVIFAADNSMLYYPARNILTVQAHPEFTPSVAHDLFDIDAKPLKARMTDSEIDGIHRSFDAPNDGKAVFAAMMDWALGERTIATL